MPYNITHESRRVWHYTEKPLRLSLHGLAACVRIEQFRPPVGGLYPHTLWIGCSDLWPPPEPIIRAQSGELLIHCSIGNIVPPPDSVETPTSVILNYALNDLSSVRNIVICGHNRCRAMEALLGLTYGDLEPGLAWWLAQAEPVLDNLLNRASVPDLPRALVEANVTFQIEQLCSYQTVIQRLQTGSLTIYGLVYDATERNLRKLVQVNSTLNPALRRRLEQFVYRDRGE